MDVVFTAIPMYEQSCLILSRVLTAYVSSFGTFVCLLLVTVVGFHTCLCCPARNSPARQSPWVIFFGSLDSMLVVMVVVLMQTMTSMKNQKSSALHVRCTPVFQRLSRVSSIVEIAEGVRELGKCSL